MATEHTGLDADELELERELASLLDVETFEPPAAFREHALLSDPAVYARRRPTGRAGGAPSVRAALVEALDTVLDDSNPPSTSGSSAAS